MKSFMVFALIIIIDGFSSIRADLLCREEIKKWTNETHICTKQAIDLYNWTAKLAIGEITLNQLTDKIALECKTANSSSCYNRLAIPIVGPCNESPFVQHFRNSFKIVIIFNEYMCQNNGQKYLDFVKNEGAQCYTSSKKTYCFNKSRSAIDTRDEPLFSDHYICPHFDADLGCIHHYNDCKNPNVGIFYREILRIAREKLSC